jgi:hypothetical protein
VSDSKSYWSSIPGAVTGIAGVLTALVGLLGVSVQLGWIGGDDNDSGSTTTATTAVGSAPTSSTRPGSGATATTASPAKNGEFAVEPTAVSFEPLQASREATVTVRNSGDVALTMRAPTVKGSNPDRFKATDVDCLGSPVPAGGSCDIKVTFDPKGPGQYSAKLVVAASNASRQAEVDLKGSALLG